MTMKNQKKVEHDLKIKYHQKSKVNKLTPNTIEKMLEDSRYVLFLMYRKCVLLAVRTN